MGAGTVGYPYGLRPVNMMGGQGMTHGIRLYQIASAYGTSIFYGDLVTLAADGTLQKCNVTNDTSTLSNMPIGVFLGVEYEDTVAGLFHRQMWTASTPTKTGKQIWAYVADDPDLLFEAQSAGQLAFLEKGANIAVVQNAGNTATGNSKVALATTTALTTELPLRIVDFVNRPGSTPPTPAGVGDAFTDCIVKINNHRLRNTVAF